MQPISDQKSVDKKSLFALNDGKAGMQDLDKERINQIIREASKDSPFYKHVMKRDERVNDQVDYMLKKWETVTEGEKANALEVMERNRTEFLLKARDLSQIVVHFDMDMFFAAVEMRDDPSLKDKPIAVGSFNMLATSNYAARRYGVRAAMAGFIGKKLCPDLIIIKGNHAKYRAESEKIMNVLRKYDPDISIVSCDEAYLNLTLFTVTSFLAIPENKNKTVENHSEWTGEKTLLPEVWDHAFEIVEKIRSEVYETTKLTCSAGISTNTMLAKICSDLNKPNGQYMLPGKSFDFIQEFVQKIDVRKIPGIGPVSDKILKAFNIKTVQDLWTKRDMIYCLHENRPSTVNFYLRVSLGLGSNMAIKEEDEPRKSKGTESSFKATRDYTWLSDSLKEMSKEVSESLEKYGMKGKTVTLRLKKDSFEAFVRSKTLSHHISDADTIFSTARSILKNELELDCSAKYRLMGVRVSNLIEKVSDPHQPTMENFLNKKSLCSEDQQSFKRHKIDHNTVRKENTNDDENSSDCPYEEFFCTFCGSSFTQYKTYNEHVSSCITASADEVNQKPTYKCPICSANTFHDLTSLNLHIDECLKKDGSN